MNGQLKTPAIVCQYMFAGKATITLKSLKTGSRFTYRVTESEDGKRFFVSVLTGSDNSSDFQYLGFFAGPDYVHGKKSRITADAPSARAFSWFAIHLSKPELPASLEVWHEGKCGHCGRKLTVPASIATGLGPDCAEKLGILYCEDTSTGLTAFGIN